MDNPFLTQGPEGGRGGGASVGGTNTARFQTSRGPEVIGSNRNPKEVMTPWGPVSESSHPPSRAAARRTPSHHNCDLAQTYVPTPSPSSHQYAATAWGRGGELRDNTLQPHPVVAHRMMLNANGPTAVRERRNGVARPADILGPGLVPKTPAIKAL